MTIRGEERENWMNRADGAVAVAGQNEFPCIKGVIRCFMCDTRNGPLESAALFHRYIRILNAFVWSFGLVYHLFITYSFTLLFLLFC